jgi:hypothetical protein
MPDRQQLHQAVDQIPEDQIFAALRFLEFLKEERLYTTDTAPLDDEPDSDEERAEAAEGYAAIERGEGIPWEQVKRELNL